MICNNYCQALNNISVLTSQLNVVKRVLDIEDDRVFEQWRHEEKMYLSSLRVVTETDVMRMEYVRVLKLFYENM